MLLTLVLAATLTVDRYQIQSNPWVNLHQRLLQQAQFPDEAKTPERLTGDERAAWERAVETYRAHFAKREPVFDRELIELNAALSAGRDPKPSKAVDALRALMPVYERGQWREDDAINRFWISIAKPLLESAAAELIAAHEKAYGRAYPKRFLVDVSAFGGQFGAYTVGDAESVHITVSSRDPEYQGFSALEMLMHEPSHGIVGPNSRNAVGAELARVSKELNVRPPDNLWHALLFYTSGVLTREALAKRGVRDYQPVIYRGMFDRQYRGMRQAIETHWGAVLAGTKTREEAIRAMLQEIVR